MEIPTKNTITRYQPLGHALRGRLEGLKIDVNTADDEEGYWMAVAMAVAFNKGIDEAIAAVFCEPASNAVEC